MNEPTAMDTLITNIGKWVEAAADYMGDFATTVAGNPILTLTVVAVPLVGVGIGLFKRAIHS